MLALQSLKSPEYLDVILEASLKNLQFDRQLESSREDYLMALIKEAGIERRALKELIAALPSTQHNGDRCQILYLLGLYVEEGSEEAWEVLLETAKAGDEDAQNVLGRTGNRDREWLAANVLPLLDFDSRIRILEWFPDDRFDDWLPRVMEGEPEVDTRLRNLLIDDNQRRMRDRPARRSVPVNDFLDCLGGKKVTFADAHWFAKGASKEQILRAAEMLLETRSPRELRLLALVFDRCSFPLPPETLFPLVRQPPHDRYVIRILGTLNRPEVREFGLAVIREDPAALEILTSSLLPEDLVVIREALPAAKCMDPDDLHGFITTLVRLVRDYERLDWQPFAGWIYENSPCSYCRSSAVDWMASHGHPPKWILHEARFDAEPDTRQVVAEANEEIKEP